MLTDFDLSVILRDSSVIPAHNLFFQVGVKLRKLKKRMSQYLLFACTTSRQHVLKPGHVKRSFRMNLVSRVFPLELYRRKSRKRNRSVVRSYSFVGTEEYVAPEILLGTGHGIPVDWWTFGVFLYEMVYGTTPFRGRNRKETFHNILSKEPEVPQQTSSLSDLILKLLVKQSDNRLGSKFGATEIKEHPFFHGIQWNALQHISRPPYVPGPFCLGKYEKDYTDLLVKSDFATLFSDCQVADSTHELRNTQAKRSCTPSEVSSEDLFPPFTNVMQTVRSIHSNGSWSSIDSKVESDIPGQQLNNVVDLGLNDVLHPTKNMMSSERFLVDEPVISFCQPEEPISRCFHPLRTCERASIYKIDLCLQSCGSCFAKDAIDWQEKSKEDSRSRLSSFACHTLSTRKHEILSKISSDSIQSNGKFCTTEVVPEVFPSFIDIEDQEDEFFDLELAMDQLAKDNVNLQESEQEDADHLFEIAVAIL
ncbi:hypothetical protein O6H91_01G100300 [Diphasiastrum complanatum]|uniref:Uncharacterized protein n=1 Tax=Diphasiastrum complanatum TaxID=34168 RepID=A0ACC2EU12_DIPCM|nr:hypothetical protein O6H91_01G100300 [Diphasiastrum complanatum]